MIEIKLFNVHLESAAGKITVYTTGVLCYTCNTQGI